MAQSGNRRKENAGTQFAVVYHPHVAKKDILCLDKVWAKKIRQAIEEKLVVKPELYGLPLRANLLGLWKLRVRDYRVVYSISSISGKIVKVHFIMHRKEVYKHLYDRQF